jgi:mycofactocin system transcriptional regulator
VRVEGVAVAASPSGVAVAAGRPQLTSRAALERTAFALFETQGFDQTSIDDIADAAGIGRRTFFRYYPSKNDLVWGDFDRELDRMRRWFDDSDPELPLMDAVRLAVVEFNRIAPGNEVAHRRRMQMILGVPTLFANSTLKFAAWRGVVAEFAARRLGMAADDLRPVVIGYSALGGSLAAYERWLRDDGTELTTLLDDAFAQLANGFRSAAGQR